MGLVITLLLVGGLFYAFVKLGSPDAHGEELSASEDSGGDRRGRDSDSGGSSGGAGD